MPLRRARAGHRAGRPREIDHDANLYATFCQEEARLRDEHPDLQIRRVVLEQDLKREYQEFLQEHNRNRSDSDGRPGRTDDEIRDWAREHDLPHCDGPSALPGPPDRIRNGSSPRNSDGRVWRRLRRCIEHGEAATAPSRVPADHTLMAAATRPGASALPGAARNRADSAVQELDRAFERAARKGRTVCRKWRRANSLPDPVLRQRSNFNAGSSWSNSMTTSVLSTGGAGMCAARGRHCVLADADRRRT